MTNVDEPTRRRIAVRPSGWPRPTWSSRWKPVGTEGVPPPVVEQIHAAAQHAFAAPFTDAMRPTITVPIVVILLAAGAVLFVRSKPAAVATAGEPVTDPEPLPSGV